MTTNAIDRQQLVIASDSRWSYVDRGHLIYVDDVGLDKIAWRQSGAMICAGFGQLITAWREWFLSPVPSEEPPPTELPKGNGEFESLSVTIFKAGTGDVLYSKGWYLPLDDVAYFAGSGAEFALRCFTEHRCAKRSVVTAAAGDYQTGGETKFVHLANGTHNLSVDQKNLQELDNDIMTKGKAMDLTTKNVVSFADYAADTGQANDRKPSAANLSAPTGQKLGAWTSEEKKRLVSVVRAMAESEKK